MNKIRALAIAVILGSAATTLPVMAAGDVAAGEVKANTCLGCHGVEGYFNAYPTYHVPKVWGQHPEYIIAALKGYRDGQRAHETMRAQAADLSDQDMLDIAAYFNSKKIEQGDSSTVAEPDGLQDKIAQCAGCHGQGGNSTNPQWPILAGQYRDYLVHSIKDYGNGHRSNPIMRAQVVGLTDDQIKALSKYFASQSSALADKGK